MQSIPAGADQRGALLINAMTIDGLPHYYVTVHLASGIFGRVGSKLSAAGQLWHGLAGLIKFAQLYLNFLVAHFCQEFIDQSNLNICLNVRFARNVCLFAVSAFP